MGRQERRGRIRSGVLCDEEPGAATFDDRSDRRRTSALAITSVLAAWLGPVGSISAMVFGWTARRELARPGSHDKGRALATFGMLLGAILTVGWGAAMAAWVGRGHVAHGASAAASAPVPPPPEMAAPDLYHPPITSEPDGGSTGAPKDTIVSRAGTITVVDVGIQTDALREELARQRAAASEGHEKLLLMLQRADCDSCASVNAALFDPLMQTALENVRIVRIDAGVFREELEELKIPTSFVPSFFLPSLDLTPKDGIDGGEWDEDVAKNVAPVLGAFVRERYANRRRPWQPLPGTGIRL